MSDEEGLRGEAGSELSSIPNLISSTSSLSLSEQSGPLSLTLSSEQSEATTSTLQEPHLDYDDEIELTQEKLQEAAVVSSSDDEEKFEDAKSSPELEDRGLNMFAQKEKHIFVLSEAGKPIFSLNGEEDMMVSLGGLMQALVSFVADSGDTIRSIKTADTNIVFLVKSPLILVGVSSTGLHTSQLTVQLLYIHSQIISVLTASQLNRIFEQRRNYDLRRLLSGSERLMTSLSQQMDRDHSYFLSAVKCLPLPTQDRNLISETVIRYAGKVKDVVFGILLADNQLISLVRMKKYFIHPADLHLVFNLINSTEAFKHSESWTPLCLPKFDSSGFLHAHVSYLTDTSPACLLLVTTDRTAFFSLSEAKKKIVERLERHGAIATISSALKSVNFTAESIDIGEMRHFLYKSRSSAQYISPVYSPCYLLEENRRRLDTVYLSIQSRLVNPAAQQVKLCHHATDQEIVLGWITQSFELYSTFSPTASKLKIITAVNKLLRWIKNEENKMFILSAPTF